MLLRVAGPLFAIAITVFPAAASAEDAPEGTGVMMDATDGAPSDIRYGVSAGAVEVLTAHGAHIGAYALVGVNAVVPLGDHALIPAIAVEVAPETSAWGGVATLTLDTPLPSAPVGFDVTAILLSDQVGGDVTLAALYGGGGVGATWFADAHWSLSVAMNAYHGVNTMAAPGWTIGPIAFAGYTF